MLEYLSVKMMERGVSIYLSFMVMTILLAISLGISVILIGQIRMMRGMGDSVVALSAADTGIERILYEDKYCRTLTSCSKTCNGIIGECCQNDFGGNGFCDGIYDTNPAGDPYSTEEVLLDNNASYTAEVAEPFVFKSKGKFGNSLRAVEIAIPNYKKVFVTSETTTGNIVAKAQALGLGDFGSDGIAAADAICEHLADEANLRGTYMAWLSSNATSSSPAYRFNQDIVLSKTIVPYRRTDNVLVAKNWNDLIDGDLEKPINLDEKGNEIPTSIFTNTELDGNICSPTNHCSNWTDESSLLLTRIGNSNETGPAWTDEGIDDDCSKFYRLYCFQQ